jgi:predicted DNA-binding transcriptional regulator AlpA
MAGRGGSAVKPQEPTLAEVLSELRQLRSDLKLSRRSLLSIPEVADVLNLSQKTIRNQLSLGTFPIKAVRAAGGVRFTKLAVEAYVQGLGTDA